MGKVLKRLYARNNKRTKLLHEYTTILEYEGRHRVITKLRDDWDKRIWTRTVCREMTDNVWETISTRTDGHFLKMNMN